MKKFAVLFALLASVGFAQAEVKMFGTMDAGFSDVKAPGSAASSTNFTSGGMTTSNLGFKGTENLGSGNRAFFELSSFLSLGNGATLGGSTANTFARSAFVGVGSDKMGSLSLGRQSNPSFLPTILFNAFGDSSAYGPLWHATYFGNTGNKSTQMYNDTAWDNSVSYTTPNMSGARATVMASKTGAGQNSGANVMYFKDALGLTAYWQRTEVNSSGSFQTNLFANNSPAESKGVGASYDLKVAKLFATWQESKDSSQKMDGKTWQVSAVVPVGVGKVMAEYADSKFTQTTTTKFKEYALGYDLPVSKRSDVYAALGRASVTGKTDGQTFGVGLRHRF